jgi:hypothetical protein
MTAGGSARGLTGSGGSAARVAGDSSSAALVDDSVLLLLLCTSGLYASGRGGSVAGTPLGAVARYTALLRCFCCNASWSSAASFSLRHGQHEQKACHTLRTGTRDCETAQRCSVT